MLNTKTKLVLFDLGGVCYEGNIKEFQTWLKDDYNLSISFADSLVSIDHRMDKAEINIAQLIEEQNKINLASIEIEDICNRWAETFRPLKRVFNLIRKLSRLGYKVAALSNLDRYNGEYFKARGDFEYFDYLFFSYEMKVVKPDKQAFLNVIEGTGLKPDKILFIDDQPANIEIAEELGFNVELMNEDLIDKLYKYVYHQTLIMNEDPKETLTRFIKNIKDIFVILRKEFHINRLERRLMKYRRLVEETETKYHELIDEAIAYCEKSK